MAPTPTPGIQAPGIRVVIRTRALNTLSVRPEIDSSLDPVTLLVNCSKYLIYAMECKIKVYYVVYINQGCKQSIQDSLIIKINKKCQ